MKKIVKSILIVGIIILICMVFKLYILDFAVLEISEAELAAYSGYYYKQLDLSEKKIYVAIDKAVAELEEDVVLGKQEAQDLDEKINRVLTAYFYDNPKIYYISNEYTVYAKEFNSMKNATIHLDYIMDKIDILTNNNKMDKVIDEIIEENITYSMTEFEKEVALHDVLAKRVEYYNYVDEDQIPTIKHTAFGALVEKQAVCDGYAKAYKILLKEVGIESIIVNEISEKTAHAWNVVKIEDEYYNVDVTSDKLERKEDSRVIHIYFNITDQEMNKTGVSNVGFKYPNCTATKYNYYTQLDYYISEQDNLYEKLGEIVNGQKSSSVLEIKVSDEYNVRRIIDTLYNLNFNDWQNSGKSSIEYSKQENVYIFPK